MIWTRDGSLRYFEKGFNAKKCLAYVWRALSTKVHVRLVITLVQKLEGTIALHRSEGTAFQITFVELEYKERN